MSLIFPDTALGNAASQDFLDRVTIAIADKNVPNDVKVSKQTIERQTNALKLWGENNDIFDKLAKIQIPSLVAGGLNDVLDNPKNVQTIASKIPYAWSAYFANSGHYFASQDYRDFADLAILFIETNKIEKKIKSDIP